MAQKYADGIYLECGPWLLRLYWHKHFTWRVYRPEINRDGTGSIFLIVVVIAALEIDLFMQNRRPLGWKP